MRQPKVYTLEQLIEYRNIIFTRAQARSKAFKDNNENYYWYRLKEIDKALASNSILSNNVNEIKGLGVITLKTKVSVTK